jgi:hypothetical protein
MRPEAGRLSWPDRLHPMFSPWVFVNPQAARWVLAGAEVRWATADPHLNPFFRLIAYAYKLILNCTYIYKRMNGVRKIFYSKEINIFYKKIEVNHANLENPGGATGQSHMPSRSYPCPNGERSKKPTRPALVVLRQS